MEISNAARRFFNGFFPVSPEEYGNGFLPKIHRERPGHCFGMKGDTGNENFPGKTVLVVGDRTGGLFPAGRMRFLYSIKNRIE